MDDIVSPRPQESSILDDSQNSKRILKSEDLGTAKIEEEDTLKIRKEKVFGFFKKFFGGKQAWVLVVLIIAIILGIYIRSMPMTDHNGNPGLYDITTRTWTLGPDLDPWLFLRNAKTIVEQGSLPERDMMRNVPLGFDNSIESQLLPYMIAYTYKIMRFIGMDVNVEYAGVVFPVIMFVLTIISFFLFVREVFVRRSKRSILKANIIALIASFFMIVIPVFLPRTIAGIPEKESAAFFFMFLALYLFIKSWKAIRLRNAIILGVLAGISTGLMAMTWGGVIYLFITIGLAGLIAFILNKIKKKQAFIYGSWIISSFLMIIIFPSKEDHISFLTSLSSGFASLIFFIIIIHLFIWNSKIKNIKFIRESKLPKTIISMIISFIVILIISIILFGPGFVIDKLKAIHQTIFKPVQGRWNITVAENRQPNFREWSQSFGPFVKEIPLMFWLFFVGAVVLFRKMLIGIRKKDAWVLTLIFIFFLCGIIFSRYAGDSIFTGENFISKLFYYTAALLMFCSLIYYYIKYDKRGDRGFEKIRMEYLILFSLFVLTLFTVRGAVRLIMVLGPIASIFVGFLIVESVERYFRAKDVWKIILGLIVIVILISSIYTFDIYYKSVKAQAYMFVPGGYNLQWQQAMDWVRTETPKNAVFAHWWDYGYWLQSIGNRATIVDGGNAITYWNYLMGRLVLTGDNQDDSLEFLYNHKATHLLIDSTDIGKYTAFSSIGSDKNYDRYSWIGIFLLDERQTQETKDQTLSVYAGGIALDEDLVINQNGKEVFLPGGLVGVGAIIVPSKNVDGSEITFRQPYIITIYNGQQYNVNLRYLYVNGQLVDFKSGIEAAAVIFPRLNQQAGNVQLNQFGAAFYISPRLMRGFLAQVFIMDNKLGNFPNFKLVHSEASVIVQSLRGQGMSLPDFVYFNGIQGPIRIWEIEYTGKEKIKEEYLETDETKYLDWAL